MTSFAIIFLALVMLAEVLARVFLHYSKKKVVLESAEILEKTVEALGKSIGNEYRDLARVVHMTEERVKRAALDTSRSLELLDRFHLPKVKRVYAAHLLHGLNSTLFIHATDKLEDFQTEVVRKFGPGWVVDAQVHIDYVPDETKAPEQRKVEPPGVEAFVHTLMMARDKFATTAVEKKSLETVISKVQKHYASTSNSTT